MARTVGCIEIKVNNKTGSIFETSTKVTLTKPAPQETFNKQGIADKVIPASDNMWPRRSAKQAISLTPHYELFVRTYLKIIRCLEVLGTICRCIRLFCYQSLTHAKVTCDDIIYAHNSVLSIVFTQACLVQSSYCFKQARRYELFRRQCRHKQMNFHHVL